VTVVGMHRSGTSALVRALGLLGARLGGSADLGKHWEHRQLRRVNQRLLSTADGRWDVPPAWPPGWPDGRAEARLLARARRVLDAELAGAPVAAWKDPRTCLTLPFWRRVLDDETVVVLVHRHPVEVADSLTARNGLVRGHGLALWERYNADALRAAAGLPTVVVSYGAILADPVARMATLTEQLARLGVALPHDPRSTDLGIVPELRHHDAGAGPVAASADSLPPVVTDSQRDLRDLLGALDGAHASLALPGALPRPHPLSDEILALARTRERGGTAEPGAGE
jgi:hypothetical protein